MVQVFSLEDPYGDCVMSAPPRSVCTSHCRAKAIINRCGCRTPDMPEIDNGQSSLNNYELATNKLIITSVLYLIFC